MVDARHAEPHVDVAGYVLGSLDDDEATAFAEHLASCDACRAEVDELAGLPALLDDIPPAWDLPPGLEERTLRALRGATSPTPSRDVVVPMTAARRRPGRLLTFAVGIAAIAAVVLGIAVVSHRSNAPAPLATIRLISVDGGPAHGDAVIRATSAGLSIDMTIEGLPSAPAGTMYTCWLVAGDDTLAHPDRVSVGSFVVRGGTVEAHWTTAADLTRFPHLGITVEPDNGNPSHQGPKVLTSV